VKTLGKYVVRNIVLWKALQAAKRRNRGRYGEFNINATDSFLSFRKRDGVYGIE
jgi:hypothetical protein